MISTDNLIKFNIFQGLSEDQVKPFCGLIREKDVEESTTIMQEGDIGASLIFLFSGEISISKALTLKTRQSDVDTREKEMIRLNSDSKPVFGEMSLFNDDDQRSATIITITDSVIGILSSQDLFKICDSDKAVGFQVMQNLAKQLADNLKTTNHQVLKLTTAFSLLMDS